MPSDGADTDEKYEIFPDEYFQLHPPTNGKLKALMQLELRSRSGGTLQQKVETAKTMGWDPTDVIPGHSREETVEEDGEEITVTRDNDLEPIGLFDYLAQAAETLCIGCDDATGRVDEVRADEVRRAVDDFTTRAFGTSGAQRIS